MKINKILEMGNFNKPDKIAWLKEEASRYLKKLEAGKDEVLAERSASCLDPTDLEQFFRHKERTEKVCQILQYLLSFLSHVPACSEIQDEPVNPAEQFREFIRYETDLLLEEDVKNAVFQETSQNGPLHGGNVWDYQGRIIVKNRELKKLAARNGTNVAEAISNLCHVLEQLCLFWFEVRREDIRRARRSDIFLYILSRIVQSRCQIMDHSGTAWENQSIAISRATLPKD
jgi:hypothetical protein